MADTGRKVRFSLAGSEPKRGARSHRKSGETRVSTVVNVGPYSAIAAPISIRTSLLMRGSSLQAPSNRNPSVPT
jgi:hypothetical protein